MDMAAAAVEIGGTPVVAEPAHQSRKNSKNIRALIDELRYRIERETSERRWTSAGGELPSASAGMTGTSGAMALPRFNRSLPDFTRAGEAGSQLYPEPRQAHQGCRKMTESDYQHSDAKRGNPVVP